MWWFRRLADVPEVGYPGSPGIDRLQLPGHDATPTISTYVYEGRTVESVRWSGPRSAAPAQTWITRPEPGETSAQTTLRQIMEALELPGTIPQYHFLIQQGIGQLQIVKTRLAEPWILEELERLCWLSIRIVEAYPDIITSEQEGVPAFAMVVAFGTLIRLYEQEGYLYEALDVAQRAAKYNNALSSLARLQERIANLEVENAC